MPRIAYTPADLEQPADLVDAIRSRRGGKLLNLDRMLLHSPAFARGWNGFLGAVRSELDLDPLLRELAICAVALLNHAQYEFAHHAPEFLAASGDGSKLAASGNGSQLAASGDGSIAIAASLKCKAKTGKNGCIALTWHDGNRSRISVGYVGEGLKSDTWYRLGDYGEFVEDK